MHRKAKSTGRLDCDRVCCEVTKSYILSGSISKTIVPKAFVFGNFQCSILFGRLIRKKYFGV